MRSWPIYLGTILALRTLPAVTLAGEKGKGWQGGIGVIGDSYSDEYQFYPPDRATARCWVEILAATRDLDFGPFLGDEPGRDPGARGYAYNWARSNATTGDMIAQGQHTGVARQVASGAVGLVWIFIGGNDFIHALHAADPPAALRAAPRRAIAHLEEAIATILRASPEVQLVVVTIPDVCDLPEFAEPLADGRLPRAWADAARAGILHYNAAIRNLRARDSRITVVDLYWPLKLALRLAPSRPVLFGVQLELRATGNHLHYGFLEDQRHAGLVLQALLARLFLDTLNTRFNAGLPPLRDQEILDLAARLRSSGSVACAGATPPAERLQPSRH